MDKYRISVHSSLTSALNVRNFDNTGFKLMGKNIRQFKLQVVCNGIKIVIILTLVQSDD